MVIAAAGASSLRGSTPGRVASGVVLWRRRSRRIAVLGVLAALAIGACRLTVNVDDPGDVDHHGDSPPTATSFPGDSPGISGYLTVGDVDYFGVTVDELSYLEAGTGGATDTFGRLLDHVGGVIAADDDSGLGRNFAVGHRLSPGLYHLEITGAGSRAVGPYKLIASITRIDEHGGSRATATYVASGSSASPGSSYGYMRFGDTDYFKTVTTRDFARLTIYSTGFTDVVARVEDAFGRVVDFDDDSGPGRNFGLTALVRAGTYYVRVEGFGVATQGQYRLFVVQS